MTGPQSALDCIEVTKFRRPEIAIAKCFLCHTTSSSFCAFRILAYYNRSIIPQWWPDARLIRLHMTGDPLDNDKGFGVINRCLYTLFESISFNYLCLATKIFSVLNQLMRPVKAEGSDNKVSNDICEPPLSPPPTFCSTSYSAILRKKWPIRGIGEDDVDDHIQLCRVRQRGGVHWIREVCYSTLSSTRTSIEDKWERRGSCV